MILGIGNDIVEIIRVEKAIQKENLKKGCIHQKR